MTSPRHWISASVGDSVYNCEKIQEVMLMENKKDSRTLGAGE
jgi:hypothetical protein